MAALRFVRHFIGIRFIEIHLHVQFCICVMLHGARMFEYYGQYCEFYFETQTIC